MGRVQSIVSNRASSSNLVFNASRMLPKTNIELAGKDLWPVRHTKRDDNSFSKHSANIPHIGAFAAAASGILSLCNVHQIQISPIIVVNLRSTQRECHRVH